MQGFLTMHIAVRTRSARLHERTREDTRGHEDTAGFEQVLPWREALAGWPLTRRAERFTQAHTVTMAMVSMP